FHFRSGVSIWLCFSRRRIVSMAAPYVPLLVEVEKNDEAVPFHDLFRDLGEQAYEHLPPWEIGTRRLSVPVMRGMYEAWKEFYDPDTGLRARWLRRYREVMDARDPD